MISKSRIIIVLIVIFLAILLSLPLPVSRNLKIRLVDFFSPLISGTNYLFEKIFSTRDLFSSIRENKILHKKIDELSAQLNTLKEAQRENERLEGLLNLKKSLPYETCACRVIGRDVTNWHKSLIIDKGKSSGVDVDMPVLSASGGIIGRIVESGSDVSRVLLITDVNSSVGGIIQDTRTIGLIEGDGSGGCILNLLPKNIDVQPGEVVITSGLGEIFPKGLLVGTITEVTSGAQGLYKTARLKLACDIDRIEEVIVIK